MSVIVAVALAGCPATGEAPDAGRDAGGDDADVPPVTGGLVFDFGTNPVVPGTVGANVHVDEVRVFWHDVRAIGDSAPGDSRTSRATFDLEWHEGSPEPLAFPQAPPGLYSRLEARVGGGERAYEIKGTVTLRDSSTESFEVSDEALGSISISLAGVEVSSATVTARVTMSLAFLAQVDWDALWDDRHDLKIEAGDPAIAAISVALATSFAITEIH